MNTLQAIPNQAVGFKHLGPGAMTGVFKQQPAVERGSIFPKTYKPGACGAHVALQANTPVGANVMATGECGLSGVVCTDCAPVVELQDATEDVPGLHRRG